MADQVRVMRVLEYTGDRDLVEATIKKSIHGVKTIKGMTIKAATLGLYPEIIDNMITDFGNQDAETR